MVKRNSAKFCSAKISTFSFAKIFKMVLLFVEIDKKISDPQGKLTKSRLPRSIKEIINKRAKCSTMYPKQSIFRASFYIIEIVFLRFEERSREASPFSHLHGAHEFSYKNPFNSVCFTYHLRGNITYHLRGNITVSEAINSET